MKMDGGWNIDGRNGNSGSLGGDPDRTLGGRSFPLTWVGDLERPELRRVHKCTPTSTTRSTRRHRPGCRASTSGVSGIHVVRPVVRPTEQPMGDGVETGSE